MNIPTPDLAQAWRDGHADGLAGRRDEARYGRDNDDARCYRDGHRMARRQVADNSEPSAITASVPPEDISKALTAEPPSGNFTPDEKPWPAVGTPEAAKVNDAMHAASFEKDPAPKTIGVAIPGWEKGPGGTPSAFSDPPAKKPRSPKPVDTDHASLF